MTPKKYLESIGYENIYPSESVIAQIDLMEEYGIDAEEFEECIA